MFSNNIQNSFGKEKKLTNSTVSLLYLSTINTLCIFVCIWCTRPLDLIFQSSDF